MKSALLFVGLVAVCSACAQGERAVAGVAEPGTTQILAIDSTGKTFQVAPLADHSFTLLTPTTHTLNVFQVKGDQVQVVKFPFKAGAAPTASTIPNHSGTVQMGALSTCDCNGDGDSTDEAQAAQDPLEQIDTDGDGEDNAHDDDDDNDGENDEGDADEDGEDGDDSEHDGDSDDDGTPDEADHDDDGDGLADDQEDGGEGEGEDGAP